MTKYRSKTYLAIPPGESIKEQLEYRGMTQKEFAARMNMSEKHISHLLNGEVQLTPETAVKLEMVLGVPASVWSNYEALYREEIIKVNIENSMEEDVKLAKRFPYKEMEALGWVPSTTKISEKVINLRKFFEVIDLSLLDKEQVSGIEGKKPDLSVKNDLLYMVWIQEARRRARDIDTEPINIRRLGNRLSEIKKFTFIGPDVFCGEIKSILADCGIALVFLPLLKDSNFENKTFLDGNKIVMAFATGEYDAARFWTKMFREFAHLFLGNIGKLEVISEEDEHEADIFAGNLLVERMSYDSFCKKKDFSESSVLKYAKKLNIAPEIVVGRMLTDGLIGEGALSNLKTKYDIA